MAFPNFFIIGAAKAGTTSLYHYLRVHPDVFLSPVKEPNYFSTDIKPELFCNTYKKNTFLDLEKYFQQKPLHDLQLAFIRKPEHYKKLFKGVTTEKAIGEASTSYLYSKIAANNIKSHHPDSKIIAILRNPAERAVSHYYTALRYGHTNLPLRKAIEADMKKKKKGWGISELFIELGMYYEQLKRYYDLYPKDNILTLLFDELTADPNDTLAKCHRFLNIHPTSISQFPQHNKAETPRFKNLNKMVTNSGIKTLLKRYMPKTFVEKMKNSFFIDGSSDNLISHEDYDFLKKIYQKDIQATSQLINKDLTHWINPLQ